MKKQIITFNKDGSVKSEMVGFIGPECEEKSSWLDKVFGQGKREYKPSYHQTEEVKICDGIPSGFCG